MRDASTSQLPGQMPPAPPPGAQGPPQSELSRRRWRLLSLTSIGAFMGPLDATIVGLALPTMGKALKLSYSEALWVSAAYLLVMAIFLIPLGRLADAYGRLRFYLVGTGVFGIFSLVCAASPNGTFLITARCFQSLGASCLAATSVALVTAAFPPNERGKALGLNVMSTYLGLTAGPVVGGLIVAHAAWQWIFVINAPIAVATIANGWFLLPAEKRDRKAGLAGGPPAGPPPGAVADGLGAAPAGGVVPGPGVGSGLDGAPGPRVGASAGAARSRPLAATGRVDWRGTVLLGLGLTSLLVPLTLVPFWGWLNARTIGLLVVAGVLLAGFVFVEGRVAFPLLDLDLVRKNRIFAAGTFAALLNYAGVFAIGLLTSVHLQIVDGFRPQRAGLLLLTQAVVMTALSPVFGRLSDKIGSRGLASGGMLLCGAGLFQLAVMPVPAHALRVVLALGTVGVGMAMFSSPNTSWVMGSVKRHQLGVAGGFLSTMRALGQGLSLGLLGALAATGLGAAGARVIFLGEKASQAAATTFADGYRTALFVAAGLAVLGAVVSLVQGKPAQVAGPTGAAGAR